MRIGSLGTVEIVEPAKKASGKFAIYLQRAQNDVLLTDGAWTNQRNCCKPPMNFTPRLFNQRRQALSHARAIGRQGTVSVREYDGPMPASNS